MKIILSLLATSLLFTLSINSVYADNTTDYNENSKYCYYSDKEYSSGSLMIQEDVVMTCVRHENGRLLWEEA